MPTRSYVQLPTEGAGKASLAFKITEAGNPAPNAGDRYAGAAVICDADGNIVDVINATPTGNERALAVRQVGRNAANDSNATRLTDGAAFYKGAADSQLPASLGQKVKAAALGVTLAGDEDLLGRFPGSLGQKTGANSMSVVFASDAAIGAMTDGTQKSIIRGGARGATAAADVTSSIIDADTSALDVLTLDGRNRLGTFISHSGRLAVTAAADAATAGKLWLMNPVGSSVIVAVRRVEFSTAPIAATAFVTSPRFTVERMTFTGVHSGAVISPAKHDTNDVAAVARMAVNTTGITPVAAETVFGFMVVPILTAVGASVPNLQEWEPSELHGQVLLRAGQGIVIRQADAGTTSDTRTAQINLAWDEY